MSNRNVPDAAVCSGKKTARRYGAGAVVADRRIRPEDLAVDRLEAYVD